MWQCCIRARRCALVRGVRAVTSRTYLRVRAREPVVPGSGRPIRVPLRVSPSRGWGRLRLRVRACARTREGRAGVRSWTRIRAAVHAGGTPGRSTTIGPRRRRSRTWQASSRPTGTVGRGRRIPTTASRTSGRSACSTVTVRALAAVAAGGRRRVDSTTPRGAREERTPDGDCVKRSRGRGRCRPFREPLLSGRAPAECSSGRRCP